VDGSRLAALAADSPDVLAQAIELLQAGHIDASVSRSTLEYRLRTYDDRPVDEVHAVLASWPVTGVAGVESLVAAMQAALAVRRLVADRAPTCEVVWTGKGSTSGVRSTVPVILEMLTSAASSVLLLSYSVWLKQVKVNGVVDRLAALSSDGLDVTWIVDGRYRDGHNVAELVACWPSNRRRPLVYQWKDLDDEIAKLHAKVLIVDDRDALVTSANLTGHGLTSNLELGLRVRGQPASDLAGHLRHLLRTGVFERYDWP
jgi:cardiolipin synthase